MIKIRAGTLGPKVEAAELASLQYQLNQAKIQLEQVQNERNAEKNDRRAERRELQTMMGRMQEFESRLSDKIGDGDDGRDVDGRRPSSHSPSELQKLTLRRNQTKMPYHQPNAEEAGSHTQKTKSHDTTPLAASENQSVDPNRYVRADGKIGFMQGRPDVKRRQLLKVIDQKRKGRIPPFLAHPIAAICLFIFGSHPYLLISSRREYSAGVQYEFGEIMDDFNKVHDIDNFYTWFDESLTAPASFDKFFRTGEAAEEFAKFAISNNTFNVLAITQTRNGCLNEDELRGSGQDPTQGRPITDQNWRCGVASDVQCRDIPCDAAGGLFGEGDCILTMSYMKVNDPDTGLKTPQVSIDCTANRLHYQ
jgi:hypothetical protein